MYSNIVQFFILIVLYLNILIRSYVINEEMLNKAVDLTIFGIAISFLLLTVLIFFIAIIKYFDKKLNNSKGEKQDSNYDKALAASVAVSLVESELENYKSI